MNYKTKTFLKSFLVIVLFGVSLQAFATWVPPSGTPPTGNTEPPINTGPTTQAKDGGIVAWDGLRSGTVLIVDGATDLKGNVIIYPNKTLTINTETYTFPANQTANGYLKTDGAGVLSWDTSAGGVSDGDKGDITVTGSGATWTIDPLAVTNGKIADDAVNSLKILDNSVTNPKIIDLAVNTAKIADDAITYAKLQNVAANSFLANITGSSADVQAIATNRIPLFASAITGTPSSTTYLRGDGSWASVGGLPSGTTGQTLRHDGSSWVANSILQNNGTNVGVGVSPSYKFQVLGESRFVSSGNNTALVAAGNIGIEDPSPAELLSIGSFTFGVAGNLSLSNGSAGGKVIIQPYSSNFSNYTLTLPANDGNSGEFLQTNGSGALSWATAGGGLPSGTTGQTLRHDGSSWVANSILQNNGTNVGVGVSPSYKFQVLGESRFVGNAGGYALTAMSGNVGIGSSVPLELLSVGNNSNGNLGVLSLSNAVSGRVIIQPNTGSFTTYTLTLPTTDGNSGEFLQTNGSGTLTWATAGGGGDNLGNHTATQALVHTVGSASLPSITFSGDTDTGIWKPSINTLGFSTAGFERLRIDSIGYVAIGKASASKILDINEDILVNGVLTGRGGGNVSSNTTFGSTALDSNTTGTANTSVGYQALTTVTTGSNNTALGYLAATSATGSFNTALGRGTMLSQTSSGGYHTAVGANALINMFGTQTGNTAVGYNSLNGISSSGNYNTAIGYQASVSNGFSNSTAVGANAIALASNKVQLGDPSVSSLAFGDGSPGLSTTASSANMFYNTTTGEIQRSTSSARYKTNILDLEIDTSKIYDLKPVSYTSKSDGLRYFGLVAEDVDKVLPELVEYNKEKNVVIGSTSEKLIPDGVKYPMLPVLLLKEVQKHEQEIDKLKKENDDLRKRLEILEAKIK